MYVLRPTMDTHIFTALYVSFLGGRGELLILTCNIVTQCRVLSSTLQHLPFPPTTPLPSHPPTYLHKIQGKTEQVGCRNTNWNAESLDTSRMALVPVYISYIVPVVWWTHAWKRGFKKNQNDYIYGLVEARSETLSELASGQTSKHSKVLNLRREAARRGERHFVAVTRTGRPTQASSPNCRRCELIVQLDFAGIEYINIYHEYT
jgi:hypothetical protein